MSQEIELYSRMADPMAAAEKMGAFFTRSGLFGVEKTETGVVLALACMAERKSPFDIVRTYHIVENKLAMRADAMLAKYRQVGGKVKWKQFDDKAAIGLWNFEGVETEIGFTMDDAKKMEVIRPRSGWTKAPDAMLRARCIAKAVRMICPEVIAGYLSVEEITDDAGDLPPKEIVLPAAAVTTTAPTEAAAPKRGRPAKSAEAPPIDVQATVTTAPVETKKEETKTEPEQKPADVRFIAKVGPDGKLDTPTVAHLIGLIGDHQKLACDWLMKKQWITNMELASLKIEKAQQIMDKFEIFIKLASAPVGAATVK